MLLDTFPQVLILTGPTGSGKSGLALELAGRLGAEIVSMDSMALYRGMDIGTAKPTPEERRRVPHHLIDVLEPWESASVAWWLERAVACCRDITGRGKRPLFVGGTPLYLKALLYGLFEGPPADEAMRRRLEEEAATTGGPSLHARLAAVDPVSAARLHPNDVRRVIRALEVWELTGRPISAWQTQWNSGEWLVASGEGRRSLFPRHWPLTTNHCLWLDLPRPGAVRADRCPRRADDRRRAGGRGAGAAAVGAPLSREAAQALGYKEMFDYLDGRAELHETVRRIQTRSRNFAKRQITWFRHLPACRPISPELTFAAWSLTML